MNKVCELLEASILMDSKEAAAKWLSLALNPEWGQVCETDGGVLSLTSVHYVFLILKNGIQASTSFS